ncbi:DEAD/DEAH box helicase [Irregularibacter muris]|uniref:DEAD/DEAH box helicase n=1 Tax=Irregularibacter muris TaxID=1796619 RepID=A0AAE3HD58_9FIRM|nr:DEAD/DEAH box helicase [Irregularibacter muris]MCR1898270.1 DEAD/DEAH box helicase [Irregularibacter muris]
MLEQLGLQDNLINGLKKIGIHQPTDIQEKTIPLGLENKDIIGQSETGSGKTFAYLLPLFQKIDFTKKETQGIILAPTHELVMQIDGQIKLLAQKADIPITSATIIGDVSVKRQIERLKEKPHIIVGSVGRVLDLIDKRKIKAHTVKTIIIDEGDRLLDQSSLPTVKGIIKSTLKERQLMVFSATISKKALEAAKALMKDPIVVISEEKSQVNPNITHLYFSVEQRDKVNMMRKLAAAIRPKKAIIFINKSDQLEMVATKLQYHHLNACAIHGTTTKMERKNALEGFRQGKYQFLVASDVAARGLDIQGVTHIFNLDLPLDTKQYLHRVGRTGRMGQAGTAISLVTQREISFLKNYEKDYNITFTQKFLYKGKIIDK